VIAGGLAQARGDYREAVAAFREAVAIQDDLPYLEPPYWYYPVRQSLGAALLQQGRPDKAEGEFRSVLEQFPNDAWALYGLREALKAQGNASAVAEVDRRLDAARAGERDDSLARGPRCVRASAEGPPRVRGDWRRGSAGDDFAGPRSRSGGSRLAAARSV